MASSSAVPFDKEEGKRYNDDSGNNSTSSSHQKSDSNTSSGSSIGDSTTNKSNIQDEQQQQLAHAESVAVFRLRLLVILLLFLAAAGVSIFIYILTRRAEHDEFVAQFEGSATIVLQRFENILEDHLGAISAMSVATVAHSIDHESDWPFVSLSFIQQRFSKTNQIAGSLYLEFNPVVADDEKEAWKAFTSNPSDRKWISDGLEYQEHVGLNIFDELTADDPLNESFVGSVELTYDAEDGSVQEETGMGPFLPVWQTSPVLRQGLVNKNRNHDPIFAKLANTTLSTGSAILGGMDRAPPGYSSHPDNSNTRFYATLLSMNRKARTEYLGDPMTDMYIPVFDSFGEDRKAAAVLRAVFHWKSYFRNILPPNIPHMNVILSNSCHGDFTYIMMGNLIEPVGPGDHHDAKFDVMGVETNWIGHEDIGDGTVIGIRLNQDECQYSLHVYPTQDYHDTYNTSIPIFMTVAVAAIFVFTMIMFLVYDRLVELRQNLVMTKAKQSDAIVSSLFPKNVRDRLMQQEELEKKKNFMAPNQRIKNYLGGGVEESRHHSINNIEDNTQGAIADLFPKCTVLFADIVGFTAWSSARDPSQVFNLLQNIYQSFDAVAKRRSVFKVETIGDCYVAVTGLPDPQPDHAIIMVKFAEECRTRLLDVTRRLEVSLGPDTADLSMRFGLHSGPVTAGVLRGDRSRFQLFGDTVNTAARVESTGVCNKIHVSQTTAELLIAANKGHWVEPRKDSVSAKGKGVLRTFWVNPQGKKALSTTSSHISDSGEAGATSAAASEVRSSTSSSTGSPTNPATRNKEEEESKTNNSKRLTEKETRLIDWVTKLFEEHLRKVITRREASLMMSPASKENHDSSGSGHSMPLYEPTNGKIPLDEIEDEVVFAEFNMEIANKEMSTSLVTLPEEVSKQIREYVATIAERYRDNPFHNFEHACHVTMSVIKLLKRIVAPDHLYVEQLKPSDLASKLHDYTYGITSDPVATLAIIFSALIHDVDHRGISNAQLAKEEPEMADMYRSKSIAEQNSLDLAWDILMQHKYSTLRQHMFASREDLEHFRQVAVNVVLATDIFDKELNALRKNRWNKAFSSSSSSQQQEESSAEQPKQQHQGVVKQQKDEENNNKDLKATIVIEHIIQASDIAHTMQHWHIYRRWNERLFMEMSSAYKKAVCAGSSPTGEGTAMTTKIQDPAEFWYQGEIQFFDNYIIPLAKKLKDCGVFGVSSDEYLNYAILNRDEWKSKGEAIVAELVAKR